MEERKPKDDNFATIIPPQHQRDRFTFGDKGLSTFNELIALFDGRFNVHHLSGHPEKLYDASKYLLTLKGKRIRPVLSLMGNQLFGDIIDDAFHVAEAIELFHTFTLVHDDIMDKAPLRRGMQTVHTKYGDSTALLAGDVLLVAAYESLNKIDVNYLRPILHLFSTTAKKVCEGQQLDMDFEDQENINLEDYVEMIGLKTSVLLAASLQMGAILGGAGLGNQQHLYEFGKNLGIAFQVQDDYLDAFGDPEKFGKKPGGDIMANKKTFLLLQALKVATPAQKEAIDKLMKSDSDDKIQSMLDIYKSCNLHDWAKELKEKYLAIAMNHLEEVAVVSTRKKPLNDLAKFLLERDM